jgi:isovaleryl-CoA dehydrogenase
MTTLSYTQSYLDKLLNRLDRSGETSAVYNTAIEFSQKYIAPFDHTMSDAQTFKADLWHAMGDQGLLGIAMPEQYGGCGMGYLPLCATISAISYASGSAGLNMLAHSLLCTDRINVFGTEEQKEKYLPDLISGKHVGALAMSEPNAGSDVVGSMSTTATKVEGGFILNGEKTWITNGGIADTTVVYARTGDKNSKKLTAFIVDKGTQGLSYGTKIDKTGMRASETYPLYFNDCFVPNAQILGQIDYGSHILMDGLNTERLGLAAIGDGLIKRAIDETIAHTTTREQFGTPLYKNQGVSFAVANMAAKMDMLQDSLYLKALHTDHDKASLTNADAAMIFLNMSDNANDITLDAMKLCGGMGYTHDYTSGRAHHDAILLSIGGGTENIRRMVIAREIYTA